MLITGIAFALFGFGLIGVCGLNSSQLVASKALSKAVIALSVLAGLVSAATIAEVLIPADPTHSGETLAGGDTVDLGAVGGGILHVHAKPLPDVKRTGKTLMVRLAVVGKDATHREQIPFQFGSMQSQEESKTEAMAANVIVPPTGDESVAKLTKVSPPGLVTVHLEYRPRRFDVQLALIVLGVLAVLAALYEGAAPSGYRRTFLTAAIIAVGVFAWMLEGGLTAEDGMWSVWIRVLYGMGAGALGGTLVPSLLSFFLPQFEAPARN